MRNEGNHVKKEKDVKVLSFNFLIINFKKTVAVPFCFNIPAQFCAGISKIHYVIIISGYMCFPVVRENLIGTASNLNRVYCLHKYILKIYKLIIFCGIYSTIS